MVLLFVVLLVLCLLLSLVLGHYCLVVVLAGVTEVVMMRCCREDLLLFLIMLRCRNGWRRSVNVMFLERGRDDVVICGQGKVEGSSSMRVCMGVGMSRVRFGDA